MDAATELVMMDESGVDPATRVAVRSIPIDGDAPVAEVRAEGRGGVSARCRRVSRAISRVAR